MSGFIFNLLMFQLLGLSLQKSLFFFFFFFFLGPPQWHMEVHRLGGKSELELLDVSRVRFR